MSEEYSIGYSEGYQAGWNAAMDATPTAAQRPWVGLTEDELADIAMQSGAYDEQLLAFARAIEAKLKERNT
jgi:hypothetical protein